MSKKVLIAHQSTIPHYRVDFYNAVEAARPNAWTFDVVYDPSESSKKRFFKEAIDERQFNFPVVDVKSYCIRYGEKNLTYQTFVRKARHYDLIIVGSGLSNITYPICSLLKLRGIKYAIWGHGRDHAFANPSGLKYLIEKFRCYLALKSDGFFAYTQSIKNYLAGKGVKESKIFVLNNTIDIIKQRRFYEKYLPKREEIRQKLGLEGKKVLLFVGRFTSNKKIDFLLESFEHLKKRDTGVSLLMVGSGYRKYVDKAGERIHFFDSTTDPDQLAKFYVSSDLYVFPGDVGLGPLQAFCYDLPVVTIDAETHNPEIAYLSGSNSLILSKNTDARDFAEEIHSLFSDRKAYCALKSGIWSTIKHLTIDEMAKNFVEGVNKTLQT